MKGKEKKKQMTMSDNRERKKKINLAKEKAGLIFINQ